jgi:hypothetical protein
MKLARFGLSAAALLAFTLVAHAAGMFSNLPVVGSVAYCVLFAGDGTTCAGFEPAGPTIVTGNERIPADTALPNGNQPQTVRIPLPAIGVGPYQFAQPLTGTSITVNPVSRRLILQPAGTIAALTVTTPAASLLVDNQTWGICSSQIVTALTLTAGSGTTISNGVTALAAPPGTGAGTCYEWTYVQSATTWFRTQ